MQYLGSAARRKFNSIWLSDVHLGFRGCNAEALLAFLKSVECDYLYLLSDIVDIWQLKKRRYWPQAHNDVVRAILGKANVGTRVIYIPGNHDEFLRDYVGHSFGKISLVDQAVHVRLRLDGSKLLILHGDQFDPVVPSSRWIATLGARGYEGLLYLNFVLNYCWRTFGFARDLARHVAAADVFVFPSLTDTFGLVMLEAMACGVPVAAYPVQGPLDVVDQGRTGVLDDDLEVAIAGALQLQSADCVNYARGFTWQRCTAQFVSHLAPIMRPQSAGLLPDSQQRSSV